MKSVVLTIKPISEFITPLKGDTLFGQICCTIKENEGKDKLEALLKGYTENQPFLVISDAFLQGYLPRPSIPLYKISNSKDPSERKALKKQKWIKKEAVSQDLSKWYENNLCEAIDFTKNYTQMHNSINRLTGTTGEDDFAPYAVDGFCYVLEGKKADKNKQEIVLVYLEIYAILDEQRITKDILKNWLENIGQTGFGKDASTGKGKFTVIDIKDNDYSQINSQYFMTLAPTCPQGLEELDSENSYYDVFVKFGKHGGDEAIGNPFKNPILMADTGAFYSLKEKQQKYFIGQGIGGNGKISKSNPNAVHQGYAPLVPIIWEVK